MGCAGVKGGRGERGVCDVMTLEWLTGRQTNGRGVASRAGGRGGVTKEGDVMVQKGEKVM